MVPKTGGALNFKLKTVTYATPPMEERRRRRRRRCYTPVWSWEASDRDVCRRCQAVIMPLAHTPASRVLRNEKAHVIQHTKTKFKLQLPDAVELPVSVSFQKMTINIVEGAQGYQRFLLC